jgi:hypothetical protein
MTDRPSSSRHKVCAHRKGLCAQGLRPIQIWVPDVRISAFKIEAHKQSLAVARSRHAQDDQAFIDAVLDEERGQSDGVRPPTETPLSWEERSQSALTAFFP